ncbi:MAG: hypothetical protein MJY62_06015, partial [Bacteroidales bacterium]|nr:hypothetical protein [Bacteroidales bacterium]
APGEADEITEVFEYYESNDWKDSAGRPVKSWKQKIVAVWEAKAKPKVEESTISYLNSEEADLAYEREKEYWDNYLKRVGKM